MHLLTNAIDAIEASQAPSKGTITVKTSVMDDAWVHVSIHDNGIGISEQVQSRMFDPFFTTKPVGQGTGLGLAVSYRVMEQQGGQLECRSQLNKGAEFTVIVPVSAVGAEAANAA